MLELYVRSQGVGARPWIVKMEGFRDSKGEEPNFTRHLKYVVHCSVVIFELYR